MHDVCPAISRVHVVRREFHFVSQADFTKDGTKDM
jgi:hypothetical protein